METLIACQRAHHTSHVVHSREVWVVPVELTTDRDVWPPTATFPATSSTFVTCECGSPTDSEVEISWLEKVNKVRPKRQSPVPCTIFRVPEHIRRCDVQAYKPLIVPIGPYHHRLAHKSAVQEHKWRCVRYLLWRHRCPERARQLLGHCLPMLKALDDKVRSCYSEDFPELKAHEMAELMLLDGCFIIHLLLKRAKREESREREREDKRVEVVLEVDKERKEEGQLMAGKEKRQEEQGSGLGLEPWMRDYELPKLELLMGEEEEELEGPFVAGLFTVQVVLYDLLKLENQIPFFVIEELFDILKTPGHEDIDLPKSALQLFCDIHPNKSESFQTSSINPVHHLLHLFHSSCVPPRRQQQQGKAPNKSVCESIPSATELRWAGVKFRKKNKETYFLDITFEKERMEIPPLRVTEHTCSLFRNLIAFEQCYADAKTYVTTYAFFMDCIIDDDNDARLLHLRGIMENSLSTDEALANLFNKLRNQIHHSPDNNYLADLYTRVNKYYYSKFHRWKAGLKRDYFSSPWTIISVIAAVLLLLLTIEQAVFAGLSYWRSRGGS